MDKVNVYLILYGRKMHFSILREKEQAIRLAGKRFNEVYDKFMSQEYDAKEALYLTLIRLAVISCNIRKVWDISENEYKKPSIIVELSEKHKNSFFEKEEDHIIVYALHFALHIIEYELNNR